MFLSLFISITSISALSSLSPLPQPTYPLKFILGNENLDSFKDGLLSDSGKAPGPSPSRMLVLAASRTKRPDILRGFKCYRGGWDFANKHYWASVGFTGAFGFILAVVWGISFGLALVVHHCCGWRLKLKGKGSNLSQWICLALLIIFTCAAAIGCILLAVGQDNFHDEAMHTLKFVVNQSDYTVQTLRNITEYLLLAKTISVAQVFIPSDVQNQIDQINSDLNNAADKLSEKTSYNSRKIQRVFTAVRTALITVSATMLVLSLIGLLLSILGHKHAIHIFIVSGWLLVTITFILCGVFVVLDNAISDTCMAMGEWADNPQAETALSDILPCVDQRTTNRTLYQSKQVVTDVVNVVNQFIYTFANTNPPPQSNFSYYNQSGPLMPPLCYPYNSQLQDSQCGNLDVSLANASQVWQNYICTVSETEMCATPGRVTPVMYGQMVTAVNVSLALQLYTPPLLSFRDCNFVRDTFRNITSHYCPPLEHHLRTVNTGLGLISVGVMLCLALWLFYANRPLREEVFVMLISLRIKSGCSYKSSCLHNDNNVLSSSMTPRREGAS